MLSTIGNATTRASAASMNAMIPIVNAKAISVSFTKPRFSSLIIDHIERVDDRLHAGIRAPKRDRKSRYECKSKCSVAIRDNARDLFAHDIERCGRQDARGPCEMIVERRGVGEQAIKRNESRNRGKNREQPEKHDAARDRQQTVFLDLLIGAPQNILPAEPRDRKGRRGAPAAPDLLRALEINPCRFAFRVPAESRSGFAPGMRGGARLFHIAFNGPMACRFRGTPGQKNGRTFVRPFSIRYDGGA